MTLASNGHIFIFEDGLEGLDIAEFCCKDLLRGRLSEDGFEH